MSILLLTFISLCIASIPEQDHTDFYIQYGKNNTDFNYFDTGTFGMDLYEDVCTKISTNTIFRNFINKNVECTGRWCEDGVFSCKKSNKDCYQVEHIIDRNAPDPEVPIECHDIAGNLVMSNGEWNMQLGNLAQKSYEDSKKEKITIYGKKHVDNAYNNVVGCCVEHIKAICEWLDKWQNWNIILS